MIILAKLVPSLPGRVLVVDWRLRERKLAKRAGAARPWLARYSWLASEQGLPGYLGVFFDEGWPKAVLYGGETEEEARAAAQADLERLTDPDLTRRCYLGRKAADYYWSVERA